MTRAEKERILRANYERILANRNISSDKDAAVAGVSLSPVSAVVTDDKPYYNDIPMIPSAVKPKMGRMVSVWNPVTLVNEMQWQDDSGF
jgi:hypothetical protein